MSNILMFNAPLMACLVEDPATKRHQPRNYLDTLEDRVALLEGAQLFSNEDTNQSAIPNHKEDEDGVSDLASKVGVLTLNAAGAEPHYLGSSSAFAFSRIVNSSLRQVVPGNPTAGFGLTEEPSSMLSPCLLPDYDSCLTLSNAYFQNLHPQYPFLHEPTFRCWERGLIGPSEATETPNFDPIPSFFVNMVYAIGSLLLSNSGSLPQQLYISAQLYINHLLSFDNLEAIQAILCCAMYSLRSPTGPSIWKLSGLALRQCTELGYHRNTKRLGPTVTPLEREMQKRTFWCAYGIDCAVAITLGRPLGIPLKEVDTEFPMDIDDSYITAAGICGRPRSSSSEPPTSMSVAIHVFRLRCFWARVHTSLYSDTTHCSPDHARTQELHAELENWLASAPPITPRVGDALSIFGSRDWFDLNYNFSILLLYRGQIIDSKGAADSVFMTCLQSCANICHGYRRQYIGRPVNYTWGAIHFLFMAGLTYLHCLWTSPAIREAVRHDDLSSTCTDCTIVLAVMAEKWKGAAPYRDIFDALASRTMTMMVDKNHDQWMLPTTLALSDGLDPADLIQWMADITDMGMSDGMDRLLTGLIGDSSQ
ncbi:hypothetical protein OIDMADRAFT_100432 [Oidiodendron maius Zn]|uniref:Xylanolytic transcriptional activator regulatory domain-containing protein n=1 Tax=Oidiodendron maius (strain Zn) TaxID=913774 RepID=A0A0C3E3D2_OIDMZ|nr:hypothetical protein OIDMADRAFT_100432 [Oidiodendron maius Zn]